MRQQRLQIDFVLQKQHLQSPHSHIHETLYMPSHTEFVIEVLCRLGFKAGLSLGIDDFAQASFLYNQSDSEVLVVCGVDQHLQADFQKGWQQVSKTYQKKVLLVSEPIFSPLAYARNATESAAAFHDHFLDFFQPDIVLYLSPYDVQIAQQRYPAQTSLPYSLADPDLMQAPLIPWQDKAQALLWLGKPEAWVYSQRSQRHPEAWTRAQQMAYFTQQQHIPFQGIMRQFTFRECYQVANQYRFQLQPLSGFAFHSARATQAALVGSIPILLLHPTDQDLLTLEAPFARHGHNCLVAFDGEYDKLLESLRDTEHMAEIARHVPELIQAGTIQSGLHGLGLRLLR